MIRGIFFDLDGTLIDSFQAITSALNLTRAHYDRPPLSVDETKRHIGSLNAVAARTADVCAVDCVTWALITKYEPSRTAAFKIIGRTPSAPALPYITSAATDDETLIKIRAALETVCADPDLADARAALLLDGIEFLDDRGYECIVAMEQEAIRLGYPTLA